VIADETVAASFGSWMSVPRRTPHAWRWRFARGPAPERDVPGGFEGFYRQAGESVPDRARLPACTEPDVEPLSGTAARYGIRIVGPPPGGMSVRDIATHLSDLYGTEIGRDTISRVIDAVSRTSPRGAPRRSRRST
jgi:hypothetical protein